VKGDIREIKSMACSNPNGEPKYPEDDTEASKVEDGKVTKNESQKVGVDTNIYEAPTLDYLTVSTAPVDGMSQGAVLGELASLRKLEEELSLMLQIEEEQAQLEALEQEELLLDMEKVCGTDEDVEKVCKKIGEEEKIKELMDLKFPEWIAAWAVKESKGDWEIALEKAHLAKKKEHELAASCTAESPSELANKGIAST